MGPLTANHRCPRRRFRQLRAAVWPALGATLGGLVPFLTNESPTTLLVLAAAALGGVLAQAMREAVVPRF
jgi:hypothetical protein